MLLVDIDFWIPDIIHGLLLNFNLFFESFYGVHINIGVGWICPEKFSVSYQCHYYQYIISDPNQLKSSQG